MVVHFPIALLLVGFLSEVIALFSKKAFFRQAGLYLLLLGAAGAAFSYFSGEAAGEGMEEGGGLAAALEMHEQAALVTTLLAAAAAVFRVGAEWLQRYARGLRVVALVLFALTTAAVARTGYLGGQLVYKHAAGVELGLGTFPGGDSAENPEE